MTSLFQKDIQRLKSVGEERSRLSAKLGAPTVGALLHTYPRDYEDWSHPVPLAEVPAKQVYVIRVTVVSPVSEQHIRSGMALYKLCATDGWHGMQIIFFNSPYTKNLLLEGKEYLLRGKVTGSFLHREMASPGFMPADRLLPLHPVYRQTAGLASHQISAAVRTALGILPNPLPGPLPELVRRACHLCSPRFALENIHFPRDRESLKQTHRRLIFEELLVLQLGLLRLKNRGRQQVSLRLEVDASAEFFRSLPLMPTNAQKRTVAECIVGMQRDYPMNRLLQGGVGNGKTTVAAALYHSAIASRIQAAFMVPTGILARQHYEAIWRFLEPLHLDVMLLTGPIPVARRHKLLSQLEEGSIRLLVGTHALLDETVEFRQLELVTADEQHRFGVTRRAALTQKGDHPHILVMSVTPIPRTLTLTIYDDLELSVLDELPSGRQRTETYVIDSTKRARVLGFIRKKINVGWQCYIICPLIEDNESDMASVTQYVQGLQGKWFFVNTVGALHGRLRPTEEGHTIEEFAAGRTDILVSTTVVGVGVGVPNAAMILIENAERYGLPQPHQLRGYIERGTERSTYILVSDAQNEEAQRRLRVMCEATSGFRIAGKDLRLHGPSDFFGARQRGLSVLRITDMSADSALLQLTQGEAEELLVHDPVTELPEHHGLQAEVRQPFLALE